MTDNQDSDRKIEEDLAIALGGGVVDSMEPTENTENEQGLVKTSPDNATTQNVGSNINPDVSSMISDIMDHTERQEETVALGPQEIPASGDFPGARGFAFLKANSHLKIQSLPILDNLVSTKTSC